MTERRWANAFSTAGPAARRSSSRSSAPGSGLRPVASRSLVARRGARSARSAAARPPARPSPAGRRSHRPRSRSPASTELARSPRLRRAWPSSSPAVPTKVGHRQARAAAALGLGQHMQDPGAHALGFSSRASGAARDAVGDGEADPEHARQLVGVLAHRAMGRVPVGLVNPPDQIGQPVRGQQQMELARRAQALPGRLRARPGRRRAARRRRRRGGDRRRSPRARVRTP